MKKKRSLLDRGRLYRAKLYFFRGHNSWLYYPLWFVTTLSVYYGLLVPNIRKTESLDAIFSPIYNNFFVFGFIFTILYVPVAVLVGRWDFHRGAYAVEATVMMNQNPVFQQLFQDVATSHSLIEANRSLLMDILEQNKEFKGIIDNLRAQDEEKTERTHQS